MSERNESLMGGTAIEHETPQWSLTSLLLAPP